MLQEAPNAAESSGSPSTVDSYCIAGSPGPTCPSPANSGYDATGNVLSYYDSVTGTWDMTNGYDSLNRLTAARSTAGDAYNGLQAAWSFDSFGNRTGESFGGNDTGNAPVPGSFSATYNASNHVQTANPGPVPTYDGAGNVTADGNNQYLYDAEGRVCAVDNLLGQMVEYLYDAEDRRIAKGTITNWSAGCDTTQNGFTMTASYILGPSGEQLTEMSWSGNTAQWAHTNVWTGRQLSATYSPDPTQNVAGVVNFHLTDWLGTRRVLTDANGNPQQNCESLPYGNGETCTPTPTEHLFTGKERDTESGNDYFGARYYASSMGRFLSPDFTGADDGPPEAVPYSDLSDPQSLNLYGYVQNNPLSRFDSDGHDCIYADGNGGGSVQRGDCTNAGGKDDNGVFIDGTINVDSFKYNADNNSSSFTYTTDSGGLGVGTLQGPNLNGGFDSGSLGAAVFGAQNASTWNNSAGTTNAVGKAWFNVVFPWESLATDLLSAATPSGTQAAGISRKPGTLGMGKGTDALRRENKVAGDIAKKLGADKNAVHELLQEGSQMEGRALTYREGLEYVAKALGKLL